MNPTRALRQHFFYLLRQTLVSALDDGCFHTAKAAAYSALLSFFPVLTTAAAVLVQARAETVSRYLERLLSQIVPPGTESVIMAGFRFNGAKPFGLLVAADIIGVWAASSVLKSLMQGFHAAYRCPRSRGILHENLIAILLVVLCFAPLVGASVLVLFGNQVERQVLAWLQFDPLLTPVAWLWHWISRVLRYLIALCAMAFAATLVYRFGPYRKQRFSRVWPGAILATLLWLVSTLAFGWYVRNVTNYNVLYGSVGTGMALLIWMYLISAISIVGCEFNAEWERLLQN